LIGLKSNAERTELVAQHQALVRVDLRADIRVIRAIRGQKQIGSAL
jgi:hypothetical protein